ncbi:MAG: M23 family metallopeptidase [Myxococcota bacterium]
MKQKALLILCFLLVAPLVQADPPPWLARRTRGLRPNLLANARVQPEDWPEEPASPEEVDPERFAGALNELCGWMPPGRPLRYATWTLRYAEEFDQDPFLLAGLVYHRTSGGCRPGEVGEFGELGLTQIRRDMHADFVRSGVYTYRIKHGERWEDKTRLLDRFPFAGPRIRRAEENLYFAAALLSIYEEQDESIHAAFHHQVPHRHHVSHFVWGDRVLSQRDEDYVFVARRRLLYYYGAIEALPPVERMGVTFGSPLDGGPRVVSSGLGSSRDGGSRRHRGIDLESLPGEPIRAIAAGTVVFAGVDLPGRHVHRQMRPHQYDQVPRDELGNGGRFVCIRHFREPEEPLRSCYMHLETVNLSAGDEVRRGALVGTVGRTGMQRSAAHLHLELHAPEEVLDASEVLAGLVIGDPSAVPER